jgi:hypothetical protein
MEQFDFTKQGVADATQFLKENNDAFYKSVNAWQLLTKNETIYVSKPEILTEANNLYKLLNK